MSSKKLGYVYVLLAITIFAGQDGFSKLLAEKYPPILVTMIRFWAFAVFVTFFAATSSKGLRNSFRTRRPLLQILRGVLLVSEVVIVVFSYVKSGLAMSQAIFQATPLIVTVLSVPLLGEKVGWRRGVALVAGLIGVLVILNPTNIHFDAWLMMPLAAALTYGLYSMATRAVSHEESPVTSVLYAGIAGAAAITLIGPAYWTPIHVSDWAAMAGLCLCGSLSHFFIIKAYSLLTAVEVQP